MSLDVKLIISTNSTVFQPLSFRSLEIFPQAMVALLLLFACMGKQRRSMTTAAKSQSPSIDEDYLSSLFLSVISFISLSMRPSSLKSGWETILVFSLMTGLYNDLKHE